MPPTVPGRPVRPLSRRTMLSAAILTAFTTVAATACTSDDDTATTGTKKTTDKAIPVVNWALPNAPTSLDYAKG
ncbi:hypothetical protein [Streptomyces plumbiresistens]|uniref:ABC transporter substrate-binding protein n=1 Tax=Streptomyces plumbiresistens TaxID=511811 RepID=A0ABP7SLV9_9ACTN